MKKDLENKIKKYCDNTEFPHKVYFSINVPDRRFKDYRYFFKYHNTHSVAQSFKTQKEIEKFIDEGIKYYEN